MIINVSVPEANGRREVYYFVVLLLNKDDADNLAESLINLIINSPGHDMHFHVAHADEWDTHYLDSSYLEAIVHSLSSPVNKIILLTEHSDGLVQFLDQPMPEIQITYVRLPPNKPSDPYFGIPNVTPLTANDIQTFAVGIFTHFQLVLGFRERRELAVRSDNMPGLLDELNMIDLTIDELRQIALLENDPNSAELIGSWFDSKRQVSLTVAGGCIGAAIAAFIGDATIAGTMHGIFSDASEAGALASLTALAAGCGVAASYYLVKVRRIANKSLRVQHIITRHRRQS